MKILEFCNSLGIGGTEKAACRWTRGLRARGHEVIFAALQDGPRGEELRNAGITVVLAESVPSLKALLESFQPDVIHAHAPGFPHEGDILGEALRGAARVPVVQTNIFGRLENPVEDEWVTHRLFISWTSCVQAARRSGRRLDEDFFESASVAVYPLDPDDGPTEIERLAIREGMGISEDEVVFSRFSRPEPNKWTDLPLRGFRIACRTEPNIRLLLREPPPHVRAELCNGTDSSRYILLPATSDATELRRTMTASDAILHTSLIGESFGYGIAEPMNLGRPVITNPVPWEDQAQIELVGPGDAGFLAATPRSIARAIRCLARDRTLRQKMGDRSRSRIRKIADPEQSTSRLEQLLNAAVSKVSNPNRSEDLRHACRTAKYLDQYQFGTDPIDRVSLRMRAIWLQTRTIIGRLIHR